MGASSELVPGGVGQFDVEADGRLVFSKTKEGRFPDPEEVVGRLV